MKCQLLASLLLVHIVSIVSAVAQIRVQAIGPIVGYTTLTVTPREQLVGRFPVYVGGTDIDNIRLGVYAAFALPQQPRLLLRPELSYVNHALNIYARNPDHDPAIDGLQWVSGSAPHAYKRLEVVPLLVWQHRFWQLHAGPFGWYRLPDPFYQQPDPQPNRYIFAELDRAIAPWVGGYKIGAGLTLGRFHADVNYSRNVTSVTRREMLHQVQPVRFFRVDAASLTYDLRFDIYRRKATPRQE